MVTEEDLLDDDEALRKKALRLQGPSNEAIELFTDYNVEFEFNSDRKAAGHNSQFKLLMSLFNWEPTASLSFFFPFFHQSLSFYYVEIDSNHS